MPSLHHCLEVLLPCVFELLSPDSASVIFENIDVNDDYAKAGLLNRAVEKISPGKVGLRYQTD